MFLARISTTQMRIHGNVAAADALLALQIEWAGVLHDYETKGVAVKKGRYTELSELLKMRRLCNSLQERHALTQEIAKGFAEIGQPLPEDLQGSLWGQE